MTQPLVRALALGPGARVAVSGCGGKTSLVGLLAQQNAASRVLVSPTTKIRPMPHALLLPSAAAALAHTPKPGIQCAGEYHPETQKLHSLPPEVLAQIHPRYHLVLMEADGSRGLPCKGWLPYEPVVPSFATHTIGIITLGALGLPATETSVLRLPQFLALTGLARGAPITLEALAKMACAPEGMFRQRSGEVILFLNQVEDAQALQHARHFTVIIQSLYPGIVHRFVIGSVHQNHAYF